MKKIIQLLNQAMLVLFAVIASFSVVSCVDSDKTVPVGDIELSDYSLEIVKGETVVLQAHIIPENATVKEMNWASSDDTVVEVDQTGKITAIAVGEAVVSVNCDGITKKCDIVVIPQSAESMKLNVTELSIVKGQSEQLIAEVYPEGCVIGHIEWKSLDANIVSVNDDGTVTGLRPGSTVVTASMGDLHASCEVIVTGIEVDEIIVEPKTVSIGIGETVSISVSVSPKDADYDGISYMSSDESVALVSESGTIVGISAGNAEITVQAGNVSAICMVTVKSETPEIGDYYYSDGTFSSSLDKSKTPIGIIFWLGDPTADDEALKREHPDCCNGLVVSLASVKSLWQANFRDYLKSVGEWIENNVDEYETITTKNDGSEPDFLNKIMGYNNTKAIEKFNEAQENSGWKVTAIEKLLEYRKNVAAPDNSSGWYLPSAKECSLLCTGEYEGNIWNIKSDPSFSDDNSPYTVREQIDKKLALIEDAEILGENLYFTSSEYPGEDEMYAYSVYFYNGAVSRDYKFIGEYNLRFIFAF